MLSSLDLGDGTEELKQPSLKWSKHPPKEVVEELALEASLDAFEDG